MVNPMTKACVVVAAGTAGTISGLTTYAAVQVVNSKTNYDEFSKKLSENANKETNKKFLESLKGFNKEVESDDKNAQHAAIGVGLASATLVSAALAASIPDDSELDQRGDELGYVAGQPYLDLRPDTNPLNPGADSVLSRRGGAFTRGA